MLGIPLGSSKFVTEACCSNAEKGDLLCNKLPDLNDVQSSMLLLRYCHVSRLNHLGRVIPPEMLHTAAAIHDE